MQRRKLFPPSLIDICRNPHRGPVGATRNSAGPERGRRVGEDHPQTAEKHLLLEPGGKSRDICFAQDWGGERGKKPFDHTLPFLLRRDLNQASCMQRIQVIPDPTSRLIETFGKGANSDSSLALVGFLLNSLGQGAQDLASIGIGHRLDDPIELI
jgi:hypothetical protein